MRTAAWQATWPEDAKESSPESFRCLGTNERVNHGEATGMPVRFGRLERRVQLSLPVEISNPEDPSATERTTTENVCSMGVRLVAEHARELNEQLMIYSFVGDLRRLARVVYCQRLPNGRFGIGVEFESVAVH
jgi:hypothetical protein